jgi:ferritin-like metal-binding protein YciE
MTVETLKDLFVHTLTDIHYAEHKILKALPQMIEAADDEHLRKALLEHKTETEAQIMRLQDVFDMLDVKAGTKKCEAIEGILKEAQGLMEDTEDSLMRDNAIIVSGQAIEHYEIVRYRSLVMWATALNMENIGQLMQKSLDEERNADENLLKFAAHAQQSAVETIDEVLPASQNRNSRIY